MMITDKVSHEWLASKGMTRSQQIGIPFPDKFGYYNNGLVWKDLFQLDDPKDFDTLDKYYEYKKNQERRAFEAGENI